MHRSQLWRAYRNGGLVPILSIQMKYREGAEPEGAVSILQKQIQKKKKIKQLTKNL
jgi:hypothetical protein